MIIEIFNIYCKFKKNLNSKNFYFLSIVFFMVLYIHTSALCQVFPSLGKLEKINNENKERWAQIEQKIDAIENVESVTLIISDRRVNFLSSFDNETDLRRLGCTYTTFDLSSIRDIKNILKDTKMENANGAVLANIREGIFFKKSNGVEVKIFLYENLLDKNDVPIDLNGIYVEANNFFLEKLYAWAEKLRIHTNCDEFVR